MREIYFNELCAPEWDDSFKPAIDRDIDSNEPSFQLTDKQSTFRNLGVLCAKGLIPDSLIERYVKLRSKLPDPGGWNMPCPYLHYQEIRDISLYEPMMKIMNELLGSPMGLHLNLTGWVSTQRNWHQDQYLNPTFVASNYIAVWIALDDIHENSGPFQFVPGSNRWPCIDQERVFKIMREEQGISPGDPLWPTKTQDWIADACAREIIKRESTVIDYLPKRGDVLFWHGRLMHRGSVPNDPKLERKALISHYSSIYHRPDFQKAKLYANSEWNALGHYFDTGMPLEGPQRV